MPTQAQLYRDLKTLARFIDLYCRKKHATAEKKPMRIRTHDVAAIAGKEVELCPECAKLLAHAFVKRSRCPMDPKPACKNCPSHCYQPEYRQKIRQVMKYSGMRMVLRGRLDYLFHLLF